MNRYCIVSMYRPTARSGSVCRIVGLGYLSCILLLIHSVSQVSATVHHVPAEREPEDEVTTGRFKLEGRVFQPDRQLDGWQTVSRVLVNGGEYQGYLMEDGTFTVSNIPSGSYVIEVIHPDFMYEPARVDITSKGKMRARKVNWIQTTSVLQIPYPLKLHPRGLYTYFQVREQWRVTDFLFSPMVLMMFLPLIIIMILPKLMSAADPETQRDMQMSLNMPKYDMPEVSEMLTSLFTGGKKPPPKSAKQAKKRL